MTAKLLSHGMKPIAETKIQFNLKKVRESRGISQNELARKLEMSGTGVQRYEWGNIKSIPFEMLERFCEVLDCTPADLLTYDPNKK